MKSKDMFHRLLNVFLIMAIAFTAIVASLIVFTGFKADRQRTVDDWFISFTLDGAADTMYIVQATGRLDTVTQYSQSMLDNAINVLNDDIYFVSVGYDTTFGLCWTSSEKPEIDIERALVQNNWISDTLGTKTTSNQIVREAKLSSVWKSLTDSLDSHKFPIVYSDTLSAGYVVYRIYYGDSGHSASRSIPVGFGLTKK